MRKFKKLLMTLGIACVMSVGVVAGATANYNSDIEGVSAAGENATSLSSKITFSSFSTSGTVKSDDNISWSYTITPTKSTKVTLDKTKIGSNSNPGCIELTTPKSNFSGKKINSIVINGSQSRAKASCFDGGKIIDSEQSLPSSAGDVEFLFGKELTGDLKIKITCSNKAFYLYSLTVNYEDAIAKEAPSKVTINNLDKPLPIEIPRAVALSPIEDIKLNAEVFYGQNDSTDANVTWKSSDENTATIDNDGVMTFKKVGTVTFTATSIATPAKENSIQVTLKDIIHSTSKSMLDIATANSWKKEPVSKGQYDENINMVFPDKATYENGTHGAQLKFYGADLAFNANDGYVISKITLDYFGADTPSIMYETSTDIKEMNPAGYTDSQTIFDLKTDGIVGPSFTVNLTNIYVKKIGIEYYYDANTLTKTTTLAWTDGLEHSVFNGKLANSISLSELSLTLKNGQPEPNNINRVIKDGTGYKVELKDSNGAIKQTINVEDANRELNFENLAVGAYTIVAKYNEITSNTIAVTVKTPAINGLLIDPASSKLEYNAYLDKYVDFEGTITATLDDGTEFNALSDFTFEYVYPDGTTKDALVLNESGCFETNTDLVINVNVYLNNYKSETYKGTYQIKVYALTSLFAINGVLDPVYANEPVDAAAMVTGTFNGNEVDLTSDHYTLSVQQYDYAEAGIKQVTVTSAWDSSITTTYDVEVLPARAMPVNGEITMPLSFVPGDTFKLTADTNGNYAKVNLDDGTSVNVKDATELKAIISDTNKLSDGKAIDNTYVVTAKDTTRNVFFEYTYNDKTIVINENNPSKITLSGLKALPTIDLTIKSGYGKTTKISSGDTIVLAGGSSITNISGSLDGDFITKVNGTLEDELVSANSVDNPITIKQDTESSLWSFKLNDQYITSKGKSLKTVQSEADSFVWNIEFDEATSKVTITAPDGNLLTYNNGSPRFKTYGETQGDTYILKYQGADEIGYVKEVIDTMRMNSDVESVCDLIDNKDYKAAFENVANIYAKNVNDAKFIEKMNVNEKYGHDTDGSEVTYLQTAAMIASHFNNAPTSLLDMMGDDSTMIITITAVSIIGISSIAAFAILSKRKKANASK